MLELRAEAKSVPIGVSFPNTSRLFVVPGSPKVSPLMGAALVLSDRSCRAGCRAVVQGILGGVTYAAA